MADSVLVLRMSSRLNMTPKILIGTLSWAVSAWDWGYSESAPVDGQFMTGASLAEARLSIEPVFFRASCLLKVKSF